MRGTDSRIGLMGIAALLLMPVLATVGHLPTASAEPAASGPSKRGASF
jgi:hypothetical protein